MTSSANKPAASDPKPGTADDPKSRRPPDVEHRQGLLPDGLGQAGAEERLAQLGRNDIAETKPNELLDFLGYIGGWKPEA